MHNVRSTVSRTLVTLATLVAVFPPVLTAQLAANTGQKEQLLVLAPEVQRQADTTYSVNLAQAMTDRFASKFRYKLSIVTWDAECEVLRKSGFECTAPLQASGAGGEQLARAVGASAYLSGWLHKASDTVRVRFRLVDVAGSGLSGWFTVNAPGITTASDLASIVADSMENQVKAAEFARECRQKRESGDASAAKDRAYKAFELYPNHPSAAHCLALVFEVQKQPVDSIIMALRRAVKGDSLDARAWESLGRRYIDAADTAKALDAFQQELQLNPGDQRLRMSVAAAMMQQQRYEEAVKQLDDLLNRSPNDMQFLQLKERACLQGELWSCEVDALASEFRVDSSLAKDTAFYGKIFGAAQSANDTAAMLKWSAEAVKNIPTSLLMWQARATAFSTAGMNDSLLATYKQILMRDSSQVGVALAAAQMLLDSTKFVVDSTVPLDTVRMFRADSLLRLVLRQNPDTTTQMRVALLYYLPAVRLVGQRIDLPLAAKWLDRSLANDVQHRLTSPANFFLGLAYAFQVFNLEPKVRATKSCSMVDSESALVEKAIPAMTAGTSTSPKTADQILGYLKQIQKAIPTYKPAFKCQ